ncbi:MAG TPA: serine/threonine-protein kinase, partial [Polyangiaceae bacterium]|nr:serine/threonine-protein kinase [Polyangiaceae bacterium]
MKLSPGDLIDQKYRIVGLLGQGGMGRVYAAVNVRIARRVAIKVLNRWASANDVLRFEREARATQIGSPHVVEVYDLGNLEDGAPYMIMEYLSGESLGARLARNGPLEPREVVPIALQILDGIGAVHCAGLVHRDLKPDNIFLVAPAASGMELVKLLDFGISKFVDSSRRSLDPALTKSGMAVGTPHYMSPEQVQGSGSLDARSDLYSVGVILYQCLSGRLPFATYEIGALLSQILSETPIPLADTVRGFDSELSRIVATSMARNVEERYRTAAEFRHALATWEPGARRDSLRTTEVPPVELTRSTRVFLRRGLLGCLLGIVSATSVVGAAKVLFGATLDSRSPSVERCQLGSSRVPRLNQPASEQAAAGSFLVAPTTLAADRTNTPTPSADVETSMSAFPKRISRTASHVDSFPPLVAASANEGLL